MYAYFDRFSIKMTKEQARACSHQGQCDDDVAALLPVLARQLDRVQPDDFRAELKKYGAWDQNELADDNANRARIVWIAACNIAEDLKA